MCTSVACAGLRTELRVVVLLVLGQVEVVGVEAERHLELCEQREKKAEGAERETEDARTSRSKRAQSVRESTLHHTSYACSAGVGCRLERGTRSDRVPFR